MRIRGQLAALARLVAPAAAAAMVAAAPAAAADPPYLKLAQALGTPQLADSSGTRDRSQLLLHFVRAGETATAWTKMTTVSILRVAANDTDGATRGVIVRLQAGFTKRHARVRAFDRSVVAPVSAFFDVTAGDERDAGIAYSPAAGFVTVAQVGARAGGRIETHDLRQLRHIVGRDR